MGSVIDRRLRLMRGAKAKSAFSLDFNGSTAYVRATQGRLPTGSAARTVATWVYQRTRPPEQFGTLVQLTGSPSFTVELANIGGVIYLFTDSVNNNNITVAGAEVPTLNAWHHVAFAFDGGSAWTYYLDGAQAKTGVFAAPINTATTGADLARHSVGGIGYTDCLLDDVLVYPGVLSAAQVAGLAAGTLDPATLDYSAGGALWRFEEGAGTTTADSSGNGHTGTLIGGPVWSTNVPPALA